MASWYAATAHAAPEYPPLQGDHEADVVVVGAGYTGLSAAIELADRGQRVVVLESRRVGWGCSGRNGGQLASGLTTHERLVRALGTEDAAKIWRLGVEGVDLVRERMARFDIQCDLRPGLFFAAWNERQLQGMRAFEASERALGYPHRLEFVPRAEQRGVVGSDGYHGGVFDHGSAHLHPLNLCLGEARGAASLGVAIHEHSAVVRIERGAQPRVHTERGSVRARHVVLAGNAYLEGLVPELSGYILPAGSYIIATEPLAETVAHEVLPRDSAVVDGNVLLDYYRLSADRRLLYGGRCNHTGRVPRSIKAALLPRLLRVFPQLTGVRVDYEWGGNVAVSLKRIPQLGRLPGGLWYAQGYSGHGVVATHVFGRLLAEAITGRSAGFDLLAGIRHWWLPGGRWFASPALALGMAWYRLWDAL